MKALERSPAVATEVAEVAEVAEESGTDVPRPGCVGGRPRDERATRAIDEAALRQVEEVGYARMSMESVASEAGVSRATVYRRYRDKADLVTAAIVTRVGEPPPADVTDPLEALVRFLEQFDSRFAEPCLEVIGCLLASREEPQAMELHRRRVVEPRTDYVRALLCRARELGLLASDADVDIALHLLVGAVFARRVAGVPAEPGWARRAVGALTTVVGGDGAARPGGSRRRGRRAPG